MNMIRLRNGTEDSPHSAQFSGTQYCSTVVLMGRGQQSRTQQSTVVQQYSSPAPELGLWGEA